MGRGAMGLRPIAIAELIPCGMGGIWFICCIIRC